MVAALDGSVGDLFVYFGSCWFDGVAGTDRQLAAALARHAPVLYVDPPISALTRLRRPDLAGAPAGSVRVLDRRLAHLVTRVAPGFSRPLARHVAAPMIREQTRRAVRQLYPGHRLGPVAAIISSRLDDLFATVAARRRLFYATDDLAAGAGLLGLPMARLLRQEARTLRRADVLATVSPALQRRYQAAGHRAHLVPNGCDPQAYADVDAAAVPADAVMPGPVAGFVGHINERIDLTLLAAVADTGCSLLLVGPAATGYRSERFAALVGRTNVRWVGQKSFRELPGYLRVIDVGLTPYADTSFNRASFPLKTLEYLAAGRAAVTSRLPATEWLATDLVEMAERPAQFADRVRALLAQPRTEALVARRRAFARRHSWADRAATLVRLLEPAGRRPASDPSTWRTR